MRTCAILTMLLAAPLILLTAPAAVQAAPGAEGTTASGDEDAPILFGVPGPGSRTTTLAWVWPDDAGDPQAIITTYWIYRGTSPGATSFYASTTSALGFTDDDASRAPLTTYYYLIRPVTEAGLGVPSNEVAVLVPP